MNRRLPLFLLLTLTLLAACGQSTQPSPAQTAVQPAATTDAGTATATEGIRIGITFIPPATWTPTPTAPTRTPRPTWTPSPTSGPTATRLPTYTPFPAYVTKPVLLDYYTSGFHTVYDFILDYTYSHLVLYADGQLIVTGQTYRQKMLSTGERQQFLAQLDVLGFYRIASNQHHDPSDHLYNFNGQYQRVFDDINYCILVQGDRSRTLCTYSHFKEYLVPEMKAVLAFLDTYPTEGMKLYLPDRLLLWVQAGRNPYDNGLPQAARDWPAYLPSLVTGDQKIMYAEGKTAQEIYRLFGNTITGLVFKEDGSEYTVYPEIVLPHEVLRNEGQ